MFAQTITITKSMFSRKTRPKSDRVHRYSDNTLNSGSSSNTSITSDSQQADANDVRGKKSSKMFTLTGDRSPLWTTLTHAQTITEFAES